MWLHSLKVAQLLRSAACLHTNQSRSYLNHLVRNNFCVRTDHTGFTVSSVLCRRPLKSQADLKLLFTNDDNLVCTKLFKLLSIGLPFLIVHLMRITIEYDVTLRRVQPTIVAMEKE